MIVVNASSRLHITLIGMNESGYRINGGIGFCVEDPQLQFRIAESSEFLLVDNRKNRLDLIEINKIKEQVEGVKSDLMFHKNLSVELLGDLGTHVGLGSGTIIKLALIEALHLINNRDYDENTLIKLSRRGGTSGIGIRTYFHGGFVFDIGHSKTTEIIPSNLAEKANRNSLLIENGPMPNWEIGICIPSDIEVLTQEEEAKFFQDTIPISQDNVMEALYHVVYGVYASIKEHDFETFCLAIKKIQNCQWKHTERKIYGSSLKRYEELIYSYGALSVGMSSLGPVLFFMSNDLDSMICKMQNQSDFRNALLIKSKMKNIGRIIS